MKLYFTVGKKICFAAVQGFFYWRGWGRIPPPPNQPKICSSGHILDLHCVRLLNAAPFSEYYAKFYFDAKHLEKGLKRGGRVKFMGPFFKKSALFHKKMPLLANIKCCPKFLEYAQLIPPPGKISPSRLPPTPNFFPPLNNDF